MLQRIAAAAFAASIGFATVARSADFNALTAGSIFLPGTSFSNGGLDFDVLAGISGARITAAGTTPTNPSFTGNFLNLPSNVEVAINLPTGGSQIKFDFVRGTSTGGLRINGGTIQFTAIPGTVDGVTVTNLLGSKTNPWGSITASGNIESFAIIGTEFWVDNLAPTFSSELAGDYNDDHVVGALDYVWWRNNSNNPSGYKSWRSSFGATGSGGGTTLISAIPEPSALLLLVIAIGSYAFRRHAR
jgi:hypothetical protein